MSAPETPLLAGRHVLVVEDEYLVANDMEHALRRLGAEIIGPVPTVDAAVAAIAENQRIDAAILDVNLRDQKCFPVASALLARNTPFVFATGYDQEVMPSDYGHVAHWQKPFGPDELARALPTLIRDSNCGASGVR